MELTVATFNAENLFSRARLFNFAREDTAVPKLAKVDQLRKALDKRSYSAADKTKIVKLLSELKDFVEIREDRERLLGRRAGKTIVKASGRGDWDGEVELKRARFDVVGRQATAAVIKRTKAHVLCMVEVEDRPTLQAFDTHVLSGRYRYEILIDGNDRRGIDVGLYSKFPISDIDTHIWDKEKESSSSPIFSRDCLEIEVALPAGPPLHVLVNHFKSKFGGSGNDKRKRQAKRVAAILQRYDLTHDRVIVAGDLNDTPDSAPLQPLLTLPNLIDVFDAANMPAGDRWTFKDKRQQLDYLLVSRPLADALDPQKVTIHREGIFFSSEADRKKHKTLKAITGHANAASDHAAVAATFEL